MVHISRGHSDPAVVRDEKGRGVSEQLRVYGADRSRYVPAMFKIPNTIGVTVDVWVRGVSSEATQFIAEEASRNGHDLKDAIRVPRQVDGWQLLVDPRCNRSGNRFSSVAKSVIPVKRMLSLRESTLVDRNAGVISDVGELLHQERYAITESPLVRRNELPYVRAASAHGTVAGTAGRCCSDD